MRIITLSNGLETKVSDIDYDYLSQFQWNCNGGDTVHAPYVRRTEGGTTIYMHRVITNCPKGYKVDHRDKDVLNNQRHNLRISTNSWNNLNRTVWGEVEYKGVDRPNSNRRRWRSRITWQGVIYHLGYFADPIDAAKAYDAKAYEFFGEFASLNFEDDYPRPDYDVNPSVDIPFFDEFYQPGQTPALYKGREY